MKVMIVITHHPTKVIMLTMEKKSSDGNNGANHSSQNESSTISRKRAVIIGDSIVKNIEGWRLNKRVKSTVAVKSIPGAITKGTKHQVRGCLEDNFPNTAILHFGTSNLKNDENAEDTVTYIMNLAISVKNENKNCRSLPEMTNLTTKGRM